MCERVSVGSRATTQREDRCYLIVWVVFQMELDCVSLTNADELPGTVPPKVQNV